MKRNRLSFFALALIAAVLLLVGLATAVATPTAHAAPTATITVTTDIDENNNDGDCSLREAIAAANTDTAVDACAAGSGSGSDTIVFDPAVSGTIVLSSTPNFLGELVISSTVTINGGGVITVSGNNVTRIFNVITNTLSANVDVTFDNLTIMNGNATIACPGGALRCGNGGGIYLQDIGGTVTVNSSTFISNSAGWGGGIRIDGGALTVNNSTFIGNSAAVDGGGINSHIGGKGTITNSTFSNNSADYGGAIMSYGPLTVINSTLSGNSAIEGGGINNNRPLTITNSTLSGNTATRGGSIFNEGVGATATVNNSTLSGNSASGGGGGIYNTETVIISNSTLFGNSAADGGGIYSDTGNTCASSKITRVRNSTISGNSASSEGGGIYNFWGRTEISHSTITANTASTSNGGGVKSYNDSDTCTHVGDTIIAGNSGGGDVAANSTGNRFFSLGYNLIGTAGGNVNFTLEFTQTGDMTNTLPSLGALADNGGPTFTHLPQNGSPAIDKIPNTNCTASPINGLDQRGAARNYDSTGSSPNDCDMGAVERRNIVNTCGFSDGNTVNAGGITFTIGTKNSLLCIWVEDMGGVNHPLAPTGIQTNRWWHVYGTSTAAETGPRVTNGFTLTMTLPYGLANATSRVCRYPGNLGGAGWNCDDGTYTSFGSGTVTRSNITGFSDWAVGNEVGPTAVALSSFSSTTTPQPINLIPLALLALLLISGSWLYIRQK